MSHNFPLLHLGRTLTMVQPTGRKSYHIGFAGVNETILNEPAPLQTERGGLVCQNWTRTINCTMRGSRTAVTAPKPVGLIQRLLAVSNDGKLLGVVLCKLA